MIRSCTHNVDVLVLARHTSTGIDAGWTFYGYVLSRQQAVAFNGRSTVDQLAGHVSVEPEALQGAVRELTDRC